MGGDRRIKKNSAGHRETLRHLRIDLLDPDDCNAKLSELHDITDLVFAAYAERPTPAELVKVNVALLQNHLDAVEPSSPQLRHVTLYQGGKAYGCHLGPFKTPAREDDPRYLGVNMPCGDPLPLRLTEQMADKESIWKRITERHGLEPIPYSQIASWGFGDAIFGTTYDNVTSTIKLRSAGFPDCIDSEEMFCTLFDRLRVKRIIP